MRIVFIRLIMGMMLTSSFLSMWLSNTATTAMMLPIANAILESLYGDLETLKENCKSTNDPERDIINGLLNVVYQNTEYLYFSASALLFWFALQSLSNHQTTSDNPTMVQH